MKKYFFLPLSACMFLASTIFAEEQLTTVEYKLTLKCPASNELSKLQATMPDPDSKTRCWEEWRDSTLPELQALIELIDSGEIRDALCEFSITKKNGEDE